MIWIFPLSSMTSVLSSFSLSPLNVLKMESQREIRSPRPVVLGVSNDGRERVLICSPLSHGSGMMDGCTDARCLF